MTKYISALLILTLFVVGCSSAQKAKNVELITKENIKTNSSYAKGYNSLIKKANTAIKTNYKSVVDKVLIPPSGDKHDFISRAVYYWPNPNSPNGLPWVYRDGKYNNKSFSETDHKNYYDAMEAIKDLSLAYNLTNNIIYAEKAVEIIKQWFVNKETKMNPNFNYAQGIPGKYDGTKSGIIDSRAILWVIQGVEFIRISNKLSNSDEQQFKLWCKSYLDWLLTSEFGINEEKSENNHGTFYDLQVVGFADYSGDERTAIEFLEHVKTKRIEKQILPDGSQPLELNRTRPHMYSIFNLSALVELADLADKYGIDLWNYKTKKCGSIKDAIDFLVNNSTSSNSKLFKGNISSQNMMRIIPKANKKFKDKYTTFLNNELNKFPNIDLSLMLFVN